MPCRCNSIRNPSSISLISPGPIYTTFAPRPNKTFNQQKQKHENRDKRADRQTGEGDRKRHQKDRLHVENQKNDRVEIILRPELNLRLADRFDPAFVDRIFLDTRFWRLKESSP